jgi:hypothetical protein
VPQPDEIKAGRLIDRFGAQAVYGRPLSYGEMHRILLAENVEHVCRKWLDKGAGKYFTENPATQSLLTWAKKAYTDGQNQHRS